jgi:hypothetical protein
MLKFLFKIPPRSLRKHAQNHFWIAALVFAGVKLFFNLFCIGKAYVQSDSLQISYLILSYFNLIAIVLLAIWSKFNYLPSRIVSHYAIVALFTECFPWAHYILGEVNCPIEILRASSFTPLSYLVAATF